MESDILFIMGFSLLWDLSRYTRKTVAYTTGVLYVLGIHISTINEYIIMRSKYD